MEKQEHEEYMRKLHNRFDKQKKQLQDANEFKMRLLGLSDNFEKIDEARKTIEDFKTNLQTGLNDAKIVISISKHCGAQWTDTEIYSYTFRNVDKLLETVEDMMFDDLEKALRFVDMDKESLSKLIQK